MHVTLSAWWDACLFWGPIHSSYEELQAFFFFVTIVTTTLWELCLLTIKYVRWSAAIRFLTIILKTLWWFSEAHGLNFLIFPELWVAILQLLLLYCILLINCHGMKVDELSKVTTLLLTFFQSTNMENFDFFPNQCNVACCLKTGVGEEALW